ncbi:hypothetical protein FZX15_14110 [Brucella suis bv. 1]|nr:hypothetical protein FZX15_14110 [Brucella suis bv. 1]
MPGNMRAPHSIVPNAKLLCTLLAGNANLSWSHYPTQNRFALLLEMLYTTAKCVARWRFPFLPPRATHPLGMF